MKHETIVRALAVAGAAALSGGRVPGRRRDGRVLGRRVHRLAAESLRNAVGGEDREEDPLGDYNGGLGEVRTQVESGTVTWDIVDVLPHEARVGCDEGLFEEIPEEYLVKTADGKSLDEDMMVPRPNKCVAPQIWWSYMMFYDEPAWAGKQAPASIADFFNVSDFPGKRGIHSWPNALIEMALVADGVDPKGVYEVMDTDEGIDRAFATLDQDPRPLGVLVGGLEAAGVREVG